MLFVLRKFVSVLVLPFNFAFLVIIAGLLLILFSRRQRIGKILLVAGVLVLLFFSLSPVANHLTASLEMRYAPVSKESVSASRVHWIVVLGGGHNSARPEGSQLGPSSLARLTEAIRIYRTRPGLKMILSGGAVFDPVPNAQAMFNMARLLGVNEKDMFLETHSWDTEDEARFISPIVKKEPFYLVTSAVHMPRSMALFKKQGTNPIPAPADFSYASGGTPIALRILPSSGALQQSERCLREYIGVTWSRLRGKAI